MSDVALNIFDSIKKYSELEDLIEDGETEGLYLECKAPSEPRLNRDIQKKLSKCLSGFSNTEGGIIIWGMSTTKHNHSDLDVLTQIEPIGRVVSFSKQIEKAIPTLTNPPITASKNKIIKKKSSDTRGVVITYVPKTANDPVQSNREDKFFFRNGDEFAVLPYQMIQRLFAATASPDLDLFFPEELIEIKDNSIWNLPIALFNKSSAVAEHTVVHVEVIKKVNCERIETVEFRNVSDINLGKENFMINVKDVIHKRLNLRIGSFKFHMKPKKQDKGFIELKIRIYACKMLAREFTFSIELGNKGKFLINELGSEYLH